MRAAASKICILLAVWPAVAQTRPKQTRASRVGRVDHSRRIKPCPIRAVLFDLDGTLTNSEPLIAKIQHEVFAEFGYAIPLERIEAMVGTPFNSSGEHRGRLQLLDIPPQHHVTIEAVYRRRLAERLHETPKIDHAEALLASLTAQGVPLAIVTNKDLAGAKALLSQMGWDRHFKTVVGHGTPGSLAKPDAAPALLALKALGVAAHDAAFVGDSPSDMTCGKNAGCPLRIGLLTEFRNPEELRAAGATHISASLDEVQRILLTPIRR